jgi:hypothetical protein
LCKIPTCFPCPISEIALSANDFQELIEFALNEIGHPLTIVRARTPEEKRRNRSP